MSTRDQPARDKEAEVEKELRRDESKINFRRAVSRKPPDAEEKQEGENGLIGMQNKYRGNAIDREDGKRGANYSIPEPRARLRNFAPLPETGK